MNKQLRQLLENCDINRVIDILFQKHKNDPHSNSDYDTCKSVYTSVINNLLGLKGDCSKSWPIHVETRKDDFDGQHYISVGLINPNYVEPPANCTPWYGEENAEVPPGCYNSNLEKYNKYWAFGGSEWNCYIDAEVINESKCDDNTLVAEIIWEITFYGFDEETHKKFFNTLNKRLDAVLKEERKKSKKSNKKAKQNKKKCKNKYKKQ